ncbi:MAG: tRNA adenosine(34) deaminase TadA [Candidatus Omnitrophota bacterium]
MEKYELYMRKALLQASRALEEDEVPVGAIITCPVKNEISNGPAQERIIAQAYNQVELLKDPTAHAEMIAITQAADFLKSKWLTGCTLYVTIEPCSMCAGALILSRISKVIFGAVDPKTGAFGSKLNINNLSLNHRIKVKQGILEKDCAEILQQFFQGKRGYRSGSWGC